MAVKEFIKRRLARFTVGIAVLLLGIFLILGMKSDRVLVTGESNWSVTGKFGINGSYPTSEIELGGVLWRNQDISLWGSWMNDDRHTGKLISQTFRAPAILSIGVAGYPDKLGNQLFLERVETKQQWKLQVPNPGERWVETKWFLPPGWWGSKVRVVAIDETTDAGGWLGISSPWSLSYLSLMRSQIASLIILPIYVGHFLLFIMPGMLLAAWWKQRWAISPAFTLILSITFSAVIGYIAFWIYWLNPEIGKAFSLGVMLTSWSLTAILYGRKKASTLKFIFNKDVILPIALMFLIGLFYISVLYIVEPNNVVPGKFPENLAAGRFFTSRPPDNIIPLLFANQLYIGSDPRHVTGDWLSSDRPPLQVGIILLQRPFMVWNGLSYQVLSTIAQCSWVAAVWALCRTITLPGRHIAIVMAFSTFSGFFLYNSVYVWPKLLAGAFVVFSLTLLLQSWLAAQPTSLIQVTLAALAAALGLLAHGGVVFTLPAMLLLLIRPRTFPKLRHLIIGCAIFYLFLAPWSAYQRFYDPPGNRLVKLHLAGVNEIDNRSSVEAIFDSYKSLTTEKIFRNKWENIKTITGQVPLLKSATIGENNEKNTLWRIGEREHISQALTFLNVAWIVLLGKGILGKNIEKYKSSLILILGVSLISLIFWALVLFGSGTTVITHSSYASIILLFVGLSILIAELPSWLSSLLLFSNAVFFTITWIWTTPPRVPDTITIVIDLPMMLVLAVSLLSIAELLISLSEEQKLGLNTKN